MRPRSGAVRQADGKARATQLNPVWEVLREVEGLPESATASQGLRRDALLRRSLAAVDAAGAAVGLLFSLLVIGGGSVGITPWALLLLPFVVVVSKAIGLYDRDQHVLRKTTVDEAPQIFNLSVLYAMTVWLTEAALFDGWLGRPEVFGLAVGTFVAISAGRALVRWVTISMIEPERCLVLGNAAEGDRLIGKLEGAPGVSTDIIGRVALDERELGRPPGGTPVLGGLDSLAQVLTEHNVERVLIAPGSHDEDEVLHAIRLVKAFGVKVSVLPRLLEVVGSSSTFDEIDGITLLGVRPYGLSKSSDFLKRTMDLVCVAAGLVLLAPLMIAMAIAIKLDSRGPVFFRQPRIGRNGRRFYMLKFRSMVPDADAIKDELRKHNEVDGGLFKIEDDPRITRVGRFLRRTSLDELPQLINVFKGDMSLVGPRPLVPDEDALIEGWERRRLAVKPGMTGLWQIFGSSRIPMPEMVKIDYLYGANWSLWLDLKILLRTVPYVLSRRGL
jgi:exopolysaccharide biosynthesis polyprenyl glycosylphosphotransferase